MGYLSRLIGRAADRFAPKKPICCLACHYAYEERVAGPCLPRWARGWLADAHKVLRESGNPAAMVEAHAAQEMILFRRHCPQNVVAQIEADHAHFSGAA